MFKNVTFKMKVFVHNRGTALASHRFWCDGKTHCAEPIVKWLQTSAFNPRLTNSLSSECYIND